MAIEIGAKLPGKVSGITKFGAFVDLEDGTKGLVHISEISKDYVKDINDILSIGDVVNVKVMSIGDDGRIGLSIRQYDDPKPKTKDRRKQDSQRKKQQDLDSLINNFLKDSDSRLSSLKRNLDGKRGGRGGRRG